MPSPTRQVKTAHRRGEIVRAALECFTEHGFEGTTLEQIRARSGASIGSIYHHFGNKEQLAAAVYLEGILDYQAGLTATIGRAADAREGVQGVVSYHLGWVVEHPEWARFLFRTRRAELVGPARDELKRANQAFLRALRAWLEPHQSAGRIRALPTDVLVSLLLGPCQEYVRLWLADEARTPPEQAAQSLAAATWGALRTPIDPGGPP